MTDTKLLIQTLRSGLNLPATLTDTGYYNWEKVFHLAPDQGGSGCSATALGCNRYLA